MNISRGRSTTGVTESARKCGAVFRIAEDGYFIGANVQFAKMMRFGSRTKFMSARLNLYRLCTDNLQAEMLTSELAAIGEVKNFSLSLRARDGNPLQLLVSMERNMTRSANTDPVKFEGVAEPATEDVAAREPTDPDILPEAINIRNIPPKNRLLLDLTDVLTIISGYVQLIDEAMPKDATTSYMLHNIMAAVDKGTRIVHRLDAGLRQESN